MYASKIVTTKKFLLYFFCEMLFLTFKMFQHRQSDITCLVLDNSEQSDRHHTG